MRDGFVRMLVGRFWEERRLTHPHLSALYDIAHEIVRVSSIKESDRTIHTARLKRLSTVPCGGFMIDLYFLDSLYHRNVSNYLDEDVEVESGSVKVMDLDLSVKRTLLHLTEIVSDVGKLYYMDVQFKNINTEDHVGEVMEKL